MNLFFQSIILFSKLKNLNLIFLLLINSLLNTLDIEIYFLTYSTSINKTSLKDVKSGTASVAYIPLPSERIRYGLSSVISHVSENEKFLNRKREQAKITSDKEELKIGIYLYFVIKILYRFKP